MSRFTRLAAASVAAGALAASTAGNALAESAEQAAFGQHVAACAQMHLGQRPDPPALTCMHDGMTMTLPHVRGHGRPHAGDARLTSATLIEP